MLPFLKKSKEASVVVPSDPVKRDHDEDYGGLHACADDLKEALKADNTPAIAAALRAAFQICDSEPHEEGPHDAS